MTDSVHPERPSDSVDSAAGPALRYDVRQYDAQREGMVTVSGWQVWAQVTMPTGRKTAPIPVALCPDQDAADEIAELLNAKYAEVSDAK